ncbi:MAG: LptF/LptG family permease [Flavobacteriales bacterium]|nr:LptF/LptG family permease [Flavobacteriales bacterium]MDG1426445.1 LptF/LptG family permease [Flavobacteriales bacterium]|tara:strand:- start:1232 stop:2308 length:1077 start_codon:yes stop_codon:yes gene_type:complete
MQKLDWYILKKFLGTFFFTLSLILLIVIIFDVSEKIDDFLEHELSIKTIIFDYYLNFIPYFGNLFSPLFIFISVIFFTSKMANDSEVIAILNSGMSFSRFLRPFIIASIILGTLSFLLGNFIIPPSNSKRIDFENKYLRNKYYSNKKNIHIQILPNQYIYMQSYNSKREIGYKFTIEKFNDNKLISKLKSDYAQYDSINNVWQINNYEIREFKDEKQIIKKGIRMDTTINLHPSEFTKRKSLVETMNFFELNNYIKREEMRGSEQIISHKIEKHKRIAFPFSSIILTLIAVAIASRKIRGGIGMHLGIGIIIAFTYILFMQISTTFAINSNLDPKLSVWIPNFLYVILSLVLLNKAQK